MPLEDGNPRASAFVGLAMKVHRPLGRGFVEGVYGDALELELKQAGIPYEREKKIEIPSRRSGSGALRLHGS